MKVESNSNPRALRRLELEETYQSEARYYNTVMVAVDILHDKAEGGDLESLDQLRQLATLALQFAGDADMRSQTSGGSIRYVPSDSLTLSIPF